VNSLGNFEERSRYSEELARWLRQEKNLKGLSPLSVQRLEANNPLRILDSKEMADKEVCKDAPKLGEFLTTESHNNYQNISNSLSQFFDKHDFPNMLQHDPHLVRGLDYYNNFCFEFVPVGKAHLSQGALLAGGRYDFLAKTLVGKKYDLPACGWAAGVDRIMDFITKDPQDLDPRPPLPGASAPIGILVILEDQLDNPEARVTLETNLMDGLETLISEFETRFGANHKYEILYEKSKNLGKRLDHLQTNVTQFSLTP
jgi:histidyl-tRNA synthetase